MQIIRIFHIIIVFLSCLGSAAAAGLSPLSANQAFSLSTTIPRANEIRIEWRIAPSYYLYVKHLHITVAPPTQAKVVLPQGELQYDPARGRFEAYSGFVSIPIFISDAQKIQSSIPLRVEYQGCSHEGFCYPPMHQDFILNLAEGTSSPVAPVDSAGLKSTPPSSAFLSLLTDQNKVKYLLHSDSLGLQLLIFLGLGLLLAFTPCVLPMVPILTSIIVGQARPSSTRTAFLLSVSYVLGTAITYAFAGLLAASMGASLQIWLQKSWVIAIVSGLLVLLGFSLFGLHELRLPRRFQHRITALANRQTSGSYIGVFCMGLLSTLIVSPCVTAPLIGILMYISQTGDKLLGAAALFTMGIGMGIPLLLIGVSAGHWLPKSGAWMTVVKKSFGLLMFAMAIWMFSRIARTEVVMILWGCFLLGTGIFLGLFLPRLIGKKTLNRVLGAALCLAAFYIMFTGFDRSIRSPSISARSAEPASSFTKVQDIEDINRQLLAASERHQPVILDFYADWCESCVTMDTVVFNTAEVKQALSSYLMLRVDLTANTEKDEALLKHFKVIAPPTVLFFDAAGQEVDLARVVGEINAKEFLTRLHHTNERVALTQ